MTVPKKMETLTETTKVKVGTWYLVRCARITAKRFQEQEHFVPIIGPKHKDPQFGVDREHYHIDGRFVGNKTAVATIFGVENGFTNHVIGQNTDPWTIIGFTFIELRCIRLQTEERLSQYRTWVDSQIGKSCKGRKCPHFGTTMHERDGVLVCPLHNLKGDIKTELIIA